MNELIKQSEKLFLNGFLVLLLLGLSIGFGIWLGRHRSVLVAAPSVHSMLPTVIQLERIGHLTTARVHITDVLWAEGEGYRGSWLVSGDARLSCDVSKARIENIDMAKRTATIRLPPPQVISARVNHEKTKTWSVEKTTWLPWKWGDQDVMRNAAMIHSEKLIETAAGSDQHLVSAKVQAEFLIRQLYEFIDWKIEVQWE